MTDAGAHDSDFFIWAGAGLMIVFGVVGGFSIGLPFLWAGLLLLLWLVWRGSVWPAELGLIAGLGLGSLLLAGIAIASGDYPWSPWLEVGVALVACSSAAFWWLRCRPGAS